jgi:excisionase family DNA binding protein
MQVYRKAGDKMIKKQELANKLNISVPMVDKLMREGMPRVKIGKSVRFDYDEVLKWLKERG